MHNPRALHMRSVLDDPRAVGRLRTVTSSFAFPGECYLPAVLCRVYVCVVTCRPVHHSPGADSFSKVLGSPLRNFWLATQHCTALRNISA